MSTTTALERIERWARGNDPGFVALLQPGLTRQEIDVAVSGLPFVLAEEVYELYQWRNGQDWGEFRLGLDKSGQNTFLPLAESVHQWNIYLNESYAIVVENNDPSAAAGGWSADPALLEAGGWLPVFGMDSDYTASLGARAGSLTSPIAYVPHDDHPDIFYQSLTAMLEYNADVYESGALRTDERGGDFFDYTIVSALRRQHFPDEATKAEAEYAEKCDLGHNRIVGTQAHLTQKEFVQAELVERVQYDLARKVARSGSPQAEAATERYLAWLLGDAEQAKQITQSLIHAPYRIMYGSEKYPILVRDFVYSFLP